MGFEILVAQRHLKSMRNRTQVSFTALIAISGVTIGVAALVIVLSVFNGFSSLLWDGLLGMSPHIALRLPHAQPMDLDADLVTRLESRDGVRAVAPFIAAEGLVLREPPGGEVIQAGVAVRGIAAEHLARVTDIGTRLWGGELDLGVQPSEGRGVVYGIVIGRGLADRLGALVGAEVQLGVLGKEILMGQMSQWRRYIVTGVFHTGIDELDSGLAFIGMHAAQRDLGWKNKISGIQLRLYDPFGAEYIAENLHVEFAAAGSDLQAVSWIDENRNLYASIRMEKWFSFLVLCLIVAVAGFNIISILTMTVAERQKEIGIFKTLGATPNSIAHIFTLEGLGIGLSGVTMGNVIGYGLCWIQKAFGIIQLPGQLYIIDALPIKMDFGDFVLISIAAVVMCYTFTRFPARDAAQVDPVAALRQ